MAKGTGPPQSGPFAEAMASAIRGVVAGKGLSGNQLAKQLNRAQSYVSVRLSGKKSWNMDELDQIAEILKVDVDDIIDMAQKIYRKQN